MITDTSIISMIITTIITSNSTINIDGNDRGPRLSAQRRERQPLAAGVANGTICAARSVNDTAPVTFDEGRELPSRSGFELKMAF